MHGPACLVRTNLSITLFSLNRQGDFGRRDVPLRRRDPERPAAGGRVICVALDLRHFSIAITMTCPPENIVILLRYFGWWPYLF
jgi:hypothetical protein